MIEMDVGYQGKLHCTVKHGPSGAIIATDAPKDNQGLGAAFSPTDLVGAALGSCMMTLMGIYAQRHNLDLQGSSAHVAKDMVTTPVRRIGKLNLSFNLPRAVAPEHRTGLENSARTCPVSKSLHPDVQVVAEFNYVN